MSPSPVLGPQRTPTGGSTRRRGCQRAVVSWPVVALLLLLAAGPVAAASNGGVKILSPGRDARLHAGEIVTIRWTPPDPNVREFELLLLLGGSGGSPIRLTGQLDPARRSYCWRVPALPAASARLQVRFSRGWGEQPGATSGSFRIVSSGKPVLAELMRREGEWWVASLAGNDAETVVPPRERLTAGGGKAGPLEPMASQSEQDHLLAVRFSRACDPTGRFGADGPRQRGPAVGRSPSAVPQRE